MIYYGTSSDDIFSGTVETDVYHAGAGNDVIYASGGTNHVFGGEGRDTFIFTGSRNDYSIVTSYDSYLGASAVVRDYRASFADGITLAGSVEVLIFSDSVIEIDKSGSVIDSPDGPSWNPIDLTPFSPTLSNTSVSENVAVGTVVGTLSAIDPEGMPVTFSLRNSDGYFAIEGNKLVVAKPIDYEKIGAPHLLSAQVDAFDPAGNTSSWTFMIDVKDGIDLVAGTSKADKLKGSSGVDVITGLAGNDKLYGFAGNDRLIGGTGKDVLTGGTGADRFIFQQVKDSTAKAPDTITDFSLKQKDKIDLSTIDANTKTAGNQAFNWLGTKDFSGKAGEIRYEKMKSDTYIYADINGDKKADFSIHLDDAMSLSKGYFIL